MALFKFVDRLIGKMKWYDISLLKLTVFFTSMFLLTAWPAFKDFFMGIEWYWHLLLSILFIAPLLKKMFF